MTDEHESQPCTAQTLARLSSSLSKLAGASRIIPSEQDFHYFHNFNQFRLPLQKIAAASEFSLDSIATASFPSDLDDAFDRLVDANDTVFDRFDATLDRLRGETSESLAEAETKDDGFQVVIGKNKKKKASAAAMETAIPSDVKVAMRDRKTFGPKPKVPFHIPTIPRPQSEFSIVVNNNNQPFDHVWLQRSEDGLRVIHPLESVSVSDFVDKNVASIEPVKPPALDSTPFKLVEEVQDLKEMASKLRRLDEFAVDLEHNQYRSFQGLTCLIQISTRTEDFVIDALKLRVQIGPYLREVFKDPSKRKVMHGSERDIVWLQRDFGIYICNLFDTGQASRELKLERNSLEYLLHHYCDVTANKEYQNADWRLRPLPEEMVRYAREDTHYLLNIYDIMRKELVSMSKDSEDPNASLLEVYKRSYDICMQLYEKELLNEDSYLYLYGLQGAGLNAEQLAVVAGLVEWRDVVARLQDESTGYILPNKALLEIAKKMPETAGKLRQMVKSKHQYVECNLGPVFSIISSSKQNSAAFQSAAQLLKEGRVGRGCEETLATAEETAMIESTEKEGVVVSSPSTGIISSDEKTGSVCVPEQRNNETTALFLNSAQQSVSSAVTVQVQKKPSRAFGALLGNSAPKKRFDSGKQDAKLEQIRAAVHFPLHSFNTNPEQAPDVPVADVAPPPMLDENSSKLDDVMMFEEEWKKEDNDNGDNDEPMSLSDLSSSFQQCFDSANQKRKAATKEDNKKSPLAGLKFEPFDYEAARRQVVFGGKPKGGKAERKPSDSSNKPKKNNTERAKKESEDEAGDDGDGDDGEAHEFSQGRRRKAFPATGNRSGTFR